MSTKTMRKISETCDFNAMSENVTISATHVSTPLNNGLAGPTHHECLEKLERITENLHCICTFLYFDIRTSRKLQSFARRLLQCEICSYFLNKIITRLNSEFMSEFIVIVKYFTGN